MAEENDLGPTGTGTVIADIGGDRGALVIYAPQSMVGDEIEISGAGGGVRTHVAVRERLMGQSRLFAAFYPSVGAGPYVVWNSPSEPAGTVTIIGGEVAELVVNPAPAGDGRRFTTAARSDSAQPVPT